MEQGAPESFRCSFFVAPFEKKEFIMYYHIRPLEKRDYTLLPDFLYETIYVPKGRKKPSKKILNMPELRLYTHGFGQKASDFGFAAEWKHHVIGTVWARIMKDYSHINKEIPSLVLSISASHRGKGLGTRLLTKLMKEAKLIGYPALSLSVQVSNPARFLYKKLGFESLTVVKGETEEEIVMVKEFS